MKRLLAFFHITSDRHFVKSLVLMLLGVLLMGICVSLLNYVSWGTDPCSAMNYGVSGKIGWSFGNYQLLFNVIFLVLVILLQVCLHQQLLGFGTIANMVFIGYIADFVSWILHSVVSVPEVLPLPLKIAVFVPVLIIFVASAALYMQSGQGMAPYDAFPFLINELLRKKHPGKDYFSILRYGIDILGLTAAILTNGSWGIATICMVVLLSPAVTLMGKWIRKLL